MSFFAELKRRNVIRVGIAYAITAWLVAQIADLVLDNIESPAWVMQALMLMLVLGLPFALIFAWAFELTPEGLKKEKDVDRTRSITHKTGHVLDRTIIAVLVVALGYFIWESRIEKGTDPVTNAATTTPSSQEAASLPSSQTSEAPSGIRDSKSVAVLPFVNMSSDPEQEFFSDGISEEILNTLAKVKELKVAGRTSSFAFKGQNQDLRKIGETLGVANILEGSVRKSGNKVRITAQLIQAEDGFHLWSESYDRELTDVFAIQDEIAEAILVQLKAQLLDDQFAAVEATRTSSESYDLYLLARQRMYERKKLSLELAAEMLDKAIALDPEYAPAYAQRAVAAILLSEKNYGTIPNEEGYAQADRNIQQALELDPSLAEGWAALGLYHLQRPGENNQAIEALEKSLAINPNLIDTSNWLQAAYGQAGRLDDALRILQAMVERDPLYPPAVGNAFAAFANRGMDEQANAVLQRARPYLEGDPSVLNVEAIQHFFRGEFAAGLPLIESAIALQPENRTYRFNLSIALMQTHQYERLIEEGIPPFQVLALTRLNRMEEAGILAQQLGAQGDMSTLLSFLNISGQTAEAVRLVEERWPDLDRFEADYPGGDLIGYHEMVEIAYAYGKLGNQQRFDDAMQRIRRVQDRQKAADADNYIFHIHEAAYYSMAGDRDRAINSFELAVDRGHIATTRPSDAWPYLEPLNGDPRFEAARLRMMEHLNRERVALGLKPEQA